MSDASPSKSHGRGAQRRGRILALQVLYESDLTEHSWRHALAHQACVMRFSKQALPYAERWVDGLLAHQAEMDTLISRFAPAWPVEQLAVVDRNVLRLALYELRYERDTPAKVVINEAVELAKTYGSETSPRFVNGVLGAALEEEDAIALER